MSATSLNPALKAAFERINADVAAAQAAERAKPREQVLREHIASCRASIVEMVAKARKERGWYRRLPEHNPGAQRFFSDTTAAWLRSIWARHALMNGSRRELRALTAPAVLMAAE